MPCWITPAECQPVSGVNMRYCVAEQQSLLWRMTMLLGSFRLYRRGADLSSLHDLTAPRTKLHHLSLERANRCSSHKREELMLLRPGSDYSYYRA